MKTENSNALYQIEDRNSCQQPKKSIDVIGGGMSKEFRTRLSKKRVLITTALLAGVYQVYLNRQHIPSKGDIQAYILSKMTKIEEKGEMGVIYFVMVLSVTELIGVSTAFLEPVGGMLFGVKKGFVANGIGKILGAMIAFTIGRTFFIEKIKSKLFTEPEGSKDDGQNIFKLLEASIEKKPFRHSLAMRFSLFPEIVCNYGLSVLEPVKWYTFLLASSIQILPYTLLWACVGNDSALRLKDPTIPINRILSATFGAVTVGFWLGVPLLTAAWTRTLMKQSTES
jgi:uncharacterized membrane protein YdjX (TVP38/TMEM64 family)